MTSQSFDWAEAICLRTIKENLPLTGSVIYILIDHNETTKKACFENRPRHYVKKLITHELKSAGDGRKSTAEDKKLYAEMLQLNWSNSVSVKAQTERRKNKRGEKGPEHERQS